MNIYDSDSYLKNVSATVLSCEECDGRIYVTLSDTIFFPEEGGQYADTGTLSYAGKEIKLLDGQIRDGQNVYTVSESIPQGTEVSCRLDWEKRFMRMQQHSGEHIVSGQINRLYGYDNVGFHLSDDGPVTLDLSGPLTADQAYDIEKRVNEIITMNLPVTPSFPSKEELKSIDYRSKKEIDGQVRLVTIGDDSFVADVCACCAPHVAKTGEIGMVVFTSVQNYKGGTRISMLAGGRAIEYVRTNMNILGEIARKFTTSPSEVSRVVDSKNEELSRLKAKLSVLAEEKLISAIKNTEGDSKCIFVDSDISGGALKAALEQGVNETEKYLIILMGDENNGFTFSLTSKTLPVVPVCKELSAKFGAKGGGREPLVSGRIKASKIEIMEFFKGK